MLKRILVIISIFSAVVVISLGAFTNTSFRNASTAGLLYDDYDLWMGPFPMPDPARLCLIEGARLYTNLSNLVDKGEEPFSGSTNDYFLIGGSTQPLFGIGHTGVVMDRYNDKDAWDTGLDDRFGNSLYGYGDVVYDSLFDDDNNGSYDRRTEVEETREIWTDEGNKDLVFALGRDMNGSLVGLFYRMNVMSTEGDSLNPVNFTFDSTDINLISGDRTYTETREGTGSTKNDMTEHLFGFSYWKYLAEARAFGLHIGYGMFSGEVNNVVDTTENWNGSPDDASITDTYSMTSNSTENVPYDGTRIIGWLSYIHEWNEITHLRFDAIYDKSSFNVKSGALREYTYQDNRVAADNHTTTTDGSETTDITGDGSSQDLTVKGKVIYDLTDDVIFAFGVAFMSDKMDTLRTEATNASGVYTYDDGDNEPNDPDDFTSTLTYSGTVETKTTEGTKTISFPVCVEFNVTKPLVFRMGAIHNISLTERTTNINLTDASPAMVHTVYGDGTVDDQFIENPAGQAIGSSEDVTESSSSTSYTYGLGYTVSENLQVDLMGFSDITDFSNWKVSATMKF
jgi:hypothetical protein